MALKGILGLVIFSVFFLAALYWDEFLCHTHTPCFDILPSHRSNVMVPSDAGVRPLKL